MSQRALHKSWQNRRPGWTHRVRWYEGADDIRLSFETPISRRNDWYSLDMRDVAQAAYDSFRESYGTPAGTGKVWLEANPRYCRKCLGLKSLPTPGCDHDDLGVLAAQLRSR